MLTSSIICLSKVQFHICSFPRSNCQFLEHSHFTTQEREENNCRFLTLQFAPSRTTPGPETHRLYKKRGHGFKRQNFQRIVDSAHVWIWCMDCMYCNITPILNCLLPKFFLRPTYLSSLFTFMQVHGLLMHHRLCTFSSEIPFEFCTLLANLIDSSQLLCPVQINQNVIG